LPVLEIVHGVVRIAAAQVNGPVPNTIRTGPFDCEVFGSVILSNWDPFKKEANHVVEEGRVSCTTPDTVAIAESGQSIELAVGHRPILTETSPLLLEAFSRATRLR
jgi:hypothetical protein